MSRRCFLASFVAALLLCGGHCPPCAAGQTVTGHRLSLDEALVDAIENSDVAQVQRLLAQGADANAEVEHLGPLLTVAGWETMDDGDFTPAQIRADAAKRRSIVVLLLKYRADINATDDQGYTPLMSALTLTNLPMARLLLEHHANVNTQNHTGLTPLTWAITTDEVDMVRLLLKHHANPNFRGWNGRLPLEASLGNLTLTQMLLDNGANPNLREPRLSPPMLRAKRLVVELNSTTLLMEAMERGSLQPVSAKIAPASGLKISDLSSALADAVAVSAATTTVFGQQKLVIDPEGTLELRRVALLLAHGADADAADADGWTPLMRAAFWGDLPLAKMLLAHGARPVTRDKGGHTALDYARSAKRLPLVRLLTNL